MSRAGAAVSTAPDAAAAAAEAAEAAAQALAGAPADLAVLFVSAHHGDGGAVAAATEVRRLLAPACLLGCLAQGVIGGSKEVESGPAVSVWAASLPGARIDPFRVELDEEDGSVELPDLGGASLVLLLADPYTLQATELVELLSDEYPGLPVVGGLAIGGGPGSQALVLDETVEQAGAVGVAISGVAVQAVVSQGCAPLGPESVITRAEGNVVFELAGKPALERLREIVSGLSDRERELASSGLLAGIVIDENRPSYERGDFLMRGILGADEEKGAIAIGQYVRVGQTLRFHARDAQTAHEDLYAAIGEALATASGPPAGALLFTCNGRGRGMFGKPDHDSTTLVDALGSPAVGGFFAGGEIGPVGGRSFLHGFTATMAIFVDADGA